MPISMPRGTTNRMLADVNVGTGTGEKAGAATSVWRMVKTFKQVSWFGKTKRSKQSCLSTGGHLADLHPNVCSLWVTEVRDPASWIEARHAGPHQTGVRDCRPVSATYIHIVGHSLGTRAPWLRFWTAPQPGRFIPGATCHRYRHGRPDMPDEPRPSGLGQIQGVDHRIDGHLPFLTPLLRGECGALRDDWSISLHP
jgi:hypothetical protein